ncbi:MAG TPA: hypothetical protein VIL85_03665, partial [Thermomicrobiales bacterium]
MVFGFNGPVPTETGDPPAAGDAPAAADAVARTAVALLTAPPAAPVVVAVAPAPVAGAVVALLATFVAVGTGALVGDAVPPHAASKKAAIPATLPPNICRRVTLLLTYNSLYPTLKTIKPYHHNAPSADNR